MKRRAKTRLAIRYGRTRRSGTDLRDAIRQAAKHAQIAATVSIDDPRTAIVRDNKGALRFYSATAWERPETPGLMPWAPPPFPKSGIIALVGPDGSWTKGPGYRTRRQGTGVAW